MKLPFDKVITSLLVIVAVVLVGCTNLVQSELPVTSPQIPISVTETMVTVTTIHPQVTITKINGKNSSIKVFKGDYHWIEYRNNITQTLLPNPRYQWEKNERIERSQSVYKGIPAFHYRTTTTLDYPEWVGDKLIHSKNGWVIVTDSYYDIQNNSFLGGTSSETIKGVKKPTIEMPAGESFGREEKPSGEMGITPFGEINITLTDQGTESVTVPAGTYPNARKYTGSFRDGTPITFWVEAGIPVPVRYQFPNKDLDGVDPFQSYELKSWA